jgi:hypothetical protein
MLDWGPPNAGALGRQATVQEGFMTQRIARVAPVHAGKVVALLYGALGIPFAAVLAFIALA